MDKERLREIAPGNFYPIRAFQEAAAISTTRMGEARKRGVELKTISIGNRKYCRGVDAIQYLEQLAQLFSKEDPHEQPGMEGAPEGAEVQPQQGLEEEGHGRIAAVSTGAIAQNKKASAQRRGAATTVRRQPD